MNKDDLKNIKLLKIKECCPSKNRIMYAGWFIILSVKLNLNTAYFSKAIAI